MQSIISTATPSGLQPVSPAGAGWSQLPSKVQCPQQLGHRLLLRPQRQVFQPYGHGYRLLRISMFT